MVRLIVASSRPEKGVSAAWVLADLWLRLAYNAYPLLDPHILRRPSLDPPPQPLWPWAWWTRAYRAVLVDWALPPDLYVVLTDAQPDQAWGGWDGSRGYGIATLGSWCLDALSFIPNDAPGWLGGFSGQMGALLHELMHAAGYPHDYEQGSIMHDWLRWPGVTPPMATKGRDRLGMAVGPPDPAEQARRVARLVRGSLSPLHQRQAERLFDRTLAVVLAMERVALGLTREDGPALDWVDVSLL